MDFQPSSITGMTMLRSAAFGALALILSALPAAAQQESSSEWDVTLARGDTREVDFTTNEGTWMSVDVSPDGEWIVFDLLGHIYRVRSAGGEAEVLTQESGVAVNFHPRYSPDGRLIAFVSDRGGQNNLWVMGADGSNPRAVMEALDARVAAPAWTPDGQYILVERRGLGEGGGGSGIWMYHVEGGRGIELVDERGASWPSVSTDGRYAYFHVETGDDVIQGGLQLRRFEFRTGEIVRVTVGETGGAASGRLSSGGAYAPEISPDGRWLAFARRIPNGKISFKGHEFGPRTALWLRELETGAERVIMDPIEMDMAEGGKVLRVLPGYGWTRDGRSIVISQGGQIRQLDVESGAVATIPFRARVHRTISEMAYTPFRITDEPFEAKFLRWHTASPDGTRLAFQAVGKLWVTDLPGAPTDGVVTLSAPPRRLTSEDFEPLEFAPAWSPDGEWIAFTTWHDTGRGHVWKVPAAGGEAVRLTERASEFMNPVWSPDGRWIVAVEGAGATARGRTITHNPWYDIVRIPAEGGAPEFVAKVTSPSGLSGVARRPIVRPSFGPEDRIFYTEQREGVSEGEDGAVTVLASVTVDGTDPRVHLTFPEADQAVPSPDGSRVAFQQGDNVYVAPFPWIGTGGEPVPFEKSGSGFPVEQLSREGGLFARWQSADVLEFGSGDRYFRYDAEAGTTDTLRVRLLVPRDIPDGSIALTGARVVTLDDRRVLEDATVLVEGSRIACVGECDTAGADRVIDASGKTIIPGFVDMHSHHFREWRGMRPRRDYESAIYLAYGVTTNLDNSMWSQNIFPTAELIAAGGMIGPRAFSTGDPLYRGDGTNQNEISSYEVAEQNVDRLASWGAVSIKQYMQPQRAQRQWIAEAARRRGLMVTAEGGDLPYNLSMIMDGQTGWEHPMSYVPLYGDVAKFFGQADAVYSPTLVVAGPGPWNIEYFFAESDLWTSEKHRRWMPWRMLLPHTRRRMLRPKTDYSFPLLAQGMADIIAEGGWGAIGSHGEHHGLAPHWEVWMAASALGPHGALEVASRHGAHFLGAEQDIGSIEVGKLADLIVLNSNPLENIRNTMDMQYVMKAGTLYEADTLDEVWPDIEPFGPYYWVNPDALRDDTRPVSYWDTPSGAPDGSRR